MGDSRSARILVGEHGWIRPNLVCGSERDIIRHSGSWHERVNQFVVPTRAFFQKLLEYGLAAPFQYPDLSLEVVAPRGVADQWLRSRLGWGGDLIPLEVESEDPDYPHFYWKANLWQVLLWLEAQYQPGTSPDLRAYAEAVEGLVRKHWPMVHKAWREVVADGVRLTHSELIQLRKALDNRPVPYLLHQKLFKESNAPA